MKRTICDVEGFLVGCDQDFDKMTGVTVLLCPEGTVGGIDLRGSATSTRQIDSLRPDHLVGQVHAICLAGGSAFGLDCAAGVMRYLAENDIGLNVRFRKIPSVPTAVVFDCALGDPMAFPTPEMAYRAATQAGITVPSGSFGAGCGTSVGKVHGIEGAMKGGQGTHCAIGSGGLKVGALVVCNAFGDVLDPATGAIVAGARSQKDPTRFADAQRVLAGGDKINPAADGPQNTVLTVIATNANLDQSALCRVAKMAHTGLARVVRPCHAAFDGDVAFTLASGQVRADENAVGALAAEAVQAAVLDAIRNADGLGKLPDASNFPPENRNQ